MGIQGLNFQTVPVAFTQGLDTHTQRKLVIPGKWDDLLNLTLSENGAPQTRDGHAALVATANGNGLALRDSQLLTINGGSVASVATAPTAATTPVDGRVGYVNISKSEVRRTTGMQDTPDCASGDGLTLYCWREKSPANVTVGINCTLVDEATGARLIDNAALRTNAAVFGVRCAFANGFFYIFYIQGTSLYCRTISTSSPTQTSAEVALITSANLAAVNFDVCVFGAGGGVMVSYGWADGTTSVRTIEVVDNFGVPIINSGPTDLIAEAQLPIATLTGLCCAAYTGAVFDRAATFATSTGAASHAGLAGTVIDEQWFVTTAATQIDNAVAATTAPVHVTACIKDDTVLGEGLAVFWDRQSEWTTAGLNPLRTTVVDSTLVTTLLAPSTLINSATFAVVAGTAAGPKGPFIAGKAFNENGSVFLPVFVGSVYNNLSIATANPRNANTQNTFFVLELLFSTTLSTQFNVVAKALYGSYGLASFNASNPTVGTPCSTPEVTSGNFAIAATELTLLVLSSGINVSPTGLVRLTMSPNFSLPLVRGELGESTYLAGGSLSAFDGAAITEQGFPLYPEGCGITVNGGGSGAMTAGVHQVVFIYEWVDNSGQRHQSAPSLPISVTTVATGSLTCQVPTLLLSQKGFNGGTAPGTDIQVVAYMTQAGGLTFNRVLLNNGAYAPVMNTLGATTVTLTIDDADATIAGNEVLYTQPNQAPTALPNVAPGPCRALAVIQNRLFFDKSDKPFWFGYSQQYVNNVGLQFSPDLEAAVPSDSGGIVAFAELDEKVVIFCGNRPYVMYGQGPQVSGGFNNYSLPVAVQSDVGCSSALSVIKMPMGVMFKSQKGWYLLGRDLSTKYIGEGVARFDANTVTSATLLADEQECRFATSGETPGVTLVYSYLVDQWSYFVQTNGDGYQPVDSVWWAAAGGGTGRYVTISLANGLNQDAPGIFTDQPGAQSAVGITTIGRTGWLHLSQLEGFQRVRRLYFTGTALVKPTSTLTITVDFDDAYGNVAPGSYSASASLATAFATWAGASIDLRHKLRRQKCKSVAFTFMETAAAGTARMNGIQALALEVGAKRGVNRLPAAQSL